MEEYELRALLDAEKSDALAAYTAAQLAEDRARSMDYYLGNMDADMPTLEGRSTTVSTDVADAIEGLMPQLMDIFAGSDEVVKFEPVGAEDEQAAQQETDYINHVFMQRNNGFMVLYTFIKDALLSKNGIVKVWWDEEEREEDETYYGLTEDQFAILSQGVLQSEGMLEITEHSAYTHPDGSPCHDVTVKSTKKLARAKALGVAPEEFGIEKGARDIQTCNYCFHEVVTQTESDLIQEGYDEQEIKSIGDYVASTNIETLERDTVGEHFILGSASDNSAARLVKVTEHYIRMDYLGDKRARLYQVVTGGEEGKVLHKNGELAVYPIDVIPFAACTPIPITHRFFGRSIADVVLQAQREKTALKRGALDNLYLHNNPRVEVAEQFAGVNTLDDLLVSRPGGVVRTKNPGGLNWQVVPDITPSVYPMMQYIDAELESRTGLSKQAQGIDANALQNQSATAVAQVFSSSQLRVKLIARVIAEGVKDLFMLLHHTIRTHAQESQTVRLRNQWITVDPRNWKTRNDLTINVGLGTGGKAQQFAQTMALANAQKELLMGGKTNIVDDAKLFNTMAELTKILGHKAPDAFFNDPSAKNPDGSQKYPPPQPQPDPKLLAVQAKTQGDMAIAQQKNQHEAAKSQADIIHQQVKAQADIEIAKVKADLDAKIAIIQAHVKAIEAESKMRQTQQQHHVNVASTVLDMAATAQAHDQKMEHADAAHEAKLKQMKSKPKADA